MASPRRGQAGADSGRMERQLAVYVRPIVSDTAVTQGVLYRFGGVDTARCADRLVGRFWLTKPLVAE
jgi:hypothetical protein